MKADDPDGYLVQDGDATMFNLRSEAWTKL
jgi:hypothetical protein